MKTAFLLAIFFGCSTPDIAVRWNGGLGPQSVTLACEPGFAVRVNASAREARAWCEPRETDGGDK